MTLEAFPSERNYQHLGDVFNRPTLSELVDGKGGADTAKDPEKGDEDKARELAMGIEDQLKKVKIPGPSALALSALRLFVKPVLN